MDRQKFGHQTKSNLLDKSKRSEIGVVWLNQTKDNRDMLNIRLTKSKLKELLTSDNGDEIKLVAFTNDKTNDRQPNFRIFGDNK